MWLDADMARNYIHNTIIEQLGRMNFLAICGGKWSVEGESTVWLHAGAGYRVSITLDFASDTYIVHRLYVRGGRVFNKGSVSHVYCDQLADVAWKASCFRDGPFGDVPDSDGVVEHADGEMVFV